MEEGEPGAAAPGMGAVTETDRNASGPLPPPAVAEAEEAQGKPLDHFISVMTADLNSIFDELLLDNLPPGRDPFGEQPPATSEVGSSSGASASSDPTSATGDGPAPSDAARKTPSRMGSLNDFFDICEMELQEGAARSTASANSAIDQPLSRETSASDLMLGNAVLAARASVAAVGVARALVASREAEVLSRFDQWWRPELSRRSVPKTLEKEIDGTFVVRPSSQYARSKALCVKFGSITLQYLVEHVEERKARPEPQAAGEGSAGEEGTIEIGCRLVGTSRVFSSLVHLLAHHTLYREGLPCLLTTEPLGEQSESQSRAGSPHKGETPNGSGVTSDTRTDQPPHAADASQTATTPSTAPSSPADSDQSPRRLARRSRPSLLFLRQSRAAGLTQLSRRASQFVHKVTKGNTSVAGRTIENFIVCTEESDEGNASLVQRNVRQFLDGMRNFLHSQHEAKFAEFLRLAESFVPGPDSEDVGATAGDGPSLNLDTIIEACLQTRVVEPLYHHLHMVAEEKLKRSGDLLALRTNMELMLKAPVEELGVNPRLVTEADWQHVQGILSSMRRSRSPMQKLRCLLDAVAAIHEAVSKLSVNGGKEAVLGADEFLPIFIYVLLHSKYWMAEVESDLMWGLLDPDLLMGEGGYYLTSYSGAVHVLKTFRSASVVPAHLPCVDDMHGFLKVHFAPETNLGMVFKTLPVRPEMTAAETCERIANKFKITRPDCFCLFEVASGTARRLDDTELPVEIKASWPLDPLPGAKYYIEYGLVPQPTS